MDGKIPAYLYDKNNTVKMILFTALFALLFINLFQPFGSRDWYPGISDIKYFAFSSLIILTGMLASLFYPETTHYGNRTYLILLRIN